MTMKKTILNNEKGFVLLAAIIACLIILAVGMIVINMSTGNLIASSVGVGDKKALAGVESGIHRELQDFNPDQSTWVVGASNYTDCTAVTNPDNYNWRQTTGGIDSRTQFAICFPAKGPNISLPHDSSTSLCTYTETVTGKNTSYDSMARVDIGLGIYCPGVNSATATTYR
jgi:hypothetical protein